VKVLYLVDHNSFTKLLLLHCNANQRHNKLYFPCIGEKLDPWTKEVQSKLSRLLNAEQNTFGCCTYNREIYSLLSKFMKIVKKSGVLYLILFTRSVQCIW
jgi:hypothetical protein